MSDKNKLHTSIRLKAMKDIRKFTDDMRTMTERLWKEHPTSADLTQRRQGRIDAYSVVIEELDEQIAKLEERYARE